MRISQRLHINAITRSFKKLATEKYAKGVKEHGGNLWEVSGLIDMALDECIDQYIYLTTLKSQIIKSEVVLGKRKDLKK